MAHRWANIVLEASSVCSTSFWKKLSILRLDRRYRWLWLELLRYSLQRTAYQTGKPEQRRRHNILAHQGGLIGSCIGLPGPQGPLALRGSIQLPIHPPAWASMFSNCTTTAWRAASMWRKVLPRISSLEFEEMIFRRLFRTSPRISFVIGGAEGLPGSRGTG